MERERLTELGTLAQNEEIEEVNSKFSTLTLILSFY